MALKDGEFDSDDVRRDLREARRLQRHLKETGGADHQRIAYNEREIEFLFSKLEAWRKASYEGKF